MILIWIAIFIDDSPDNRMKEKEEGEDKYEVKSSLKKEESKNFDFI
jgi:hypothetical protein